MKNEYEKPVLRRAAALSKMTADACPSGFILIPGHNGSELDHCEPITDVDPK